MRKSLLIAVLGVFAIGAALTSHEARAGSPYLGGTYYGGIDAYSTYSTESIPFYWQFSPVYYSLPVARTYGYSPYAYPAGVQTPEIIVEPEVMMNPYAPRGKTLAEPAGRVTSRVKRIQNPFVTASATEVVVEERSQAREELSMVLDAWHNMPTELRAQIMNLVQSAQ